MIIISTKNIGLPELTEEELIIDFACFLYERKRLSMGRARTLSGLDQIAFQKELAKRDIHIHFTEKDFEVDLENLGLK